LAPGMHSDPGTLVLRNLDMQAGATLEVHAHADGRADKIQVIDSITLAGRVKTLAQAGDWQAHTRYTIVRAEQGLDGARFDGATADRPIPAPELSYDELHVYRSRVRSGTPLDDDGETPTEDEVGEVVDEEDDDPPPPDPRPDPTP